MVSNYISTWKGKHNALILPNKTGTGEWLTILALLCSTSSLGSSSNTNLCNFIIVKYEWPITLAWQQDNKAVHIISLTVPFKMRCCWLWFSSIEFELIWTEETQCWMSVADQLRHTLQKSVPDWPASLSITEPLSAVCDWSNILSAPV